MGKLISIIITSFNQADSISKAIESALEQDYGFKEIIISDDCSNDYTHEICKKYAEKNPCITLYRNEKNLGRTTNYRECLENRANGEWVSVLDGDDYYIDKQFLSESNKLIQKYPDAVCLLANVRKLMPSGETRDLSKNRFQLSEINDGNLIFDLYSKKLRFGHPGTIYKRSTALKVDPYNFDSIGEDAELMLKLMIDSKVIFLNRFVHMYVQHSTNITSTTDFQYLMRRLVMLDSVYKFALENSNSLEKSKIENWRKKLIIEKFLEINLLCGIKNPGGTKELDEAFKLKYPDLYKKMLIDIRKIMINLLLKRRKLLYFVLKYVLGKEEFVRKYF